MDEMQLLESVNRIVDSCYTRTDLKRFDGFVPIMPELYSRNEVIFSDGTIDCLERPLCFAAYVPGKKRQDDQLMKLQRTPGREIVKRIGRFQANCYSYSRQFIDEAPYRIPDTYVHLGNNGTFDRIIVPKGFNVNPKIAEDVLVASQVSLGAAFWVENSFRVYIKPVDGALGFTIPIDTVDQCKNLFKMRDIEDGEKRRKALKHFVKEHLRKKQRSDEKALIHRYLLGKTEFSWNGYYCRNDIPIELERKAAQ